jgi:hypothetical protein
MSRRFLEDVASLSLFDGGSYSRGHVDVNHKLTYTTECLFGAIEAYPVIVHLYMEVNQEPAPSHLDFHVGTLRLGRTEFRTIPFPLNWLGNRVKGDIESEVLKGVAAIAAGGNLPANVTEALGKYNVSLLPDGM